MSVQTSITEFFNSRKRPATDDQRKVSQPNKKVMILEKIDDDVSSCPKFNSTEELSANVPPARRKLIYIDKQHNSLKIHSKKSLCLSKATDGKKRLEKTKTGDRHQLDIRKTFSSLNRDRNTVTKEDNVGESSKSFEMPKGSSTPKKHVSIEVMEKDGGKADCEKSVVIKPVDNNTSAVDSVKNPPKTDTLKLRNELSLGEIKGKLMGSSRRDDIKAALNKLNEGFLKLDKIREKTITADRPTIKKFDTVSIEVPSSPSKTPVKLSSVMSPAKLREAVFKSPGRTVRMEPVYVSPRKLFEVQPEPNPLASPTKLPAFQRYQALISEGRSALTLPFKYRCLAETFRGIETVVSMMHNRGETVTFTKLKSAVQELLRRNLYQKHLGQIRAVYEEAFDVTCEKIPTVGKHKHQPDQHDLVIRPILKSTAKPASANSSSAESSHNRMEMTPELLLERRRVFYNRLLDKTKAYHEEFLLSLDPPIRVSKDLITRWHPEFDVDDVPDIEPTTLPEPPSVQKAASAKDVLERARNLFGSNPRLTTAMLKVTESTSQSVTVPVTPATTNTGPAIAALASALKGIPKSLLEKVRAKQAAKALEAMTRSPSQAKEAVRLTRLPEIARIVRNIFISEKKSVLTRELILKKLADSYRENLSFCELNDHLNLLQEKTPEWLSFCTLRKTDFVKFVKDADMASIMAHLESVASENSY